MSKIISIIGAKDGVGATTVAYNVACEAMKELKSKVLLINLSYPHELSLLTKSHLKTIDETCSMFSKYSLSIIDGMLKVQPYGVAVLERNNDLSYETLFEVMSQLSRIYQVIIVDCGADIFHQKIEVFKKSSLIGIVTGAEERFLLETERKIKHLTHALIPRSTLRIVNGNNKEFQIRTSYIEERLKTQSVCTSSFVSEIKNCEIINEAETNEKSSIKQEVLKKFLEMSDKQQFESSKTISSEFLYSKTVDNVKNIMCGMEPSLLKSVDTEQTVKEIVNEVLGLGELEDFLADENVTEIMINGLDQVYIEREGRLFLTSVKYSSDSQLMKLAERITSPIGRRVDESSPMVDARLPNGSRVNIIIPPLSLNGPVITIRKFLGKTFSTKALVERNSLSEEMLKLLEECISKKLNILISGGTGSGKTTLLNILSSFIPDGERIVTIEDSAELNLYQKHVVRLESRPPNVENKGEVTVRELVKNALRMRPDRIIVGECRGGEALDMLQAMNTGHNGSLTTIHANSARDSIARLETIVMFAGINLPSHTIREQIASAIDIVIQLNRFPDGTRRITQIAEITGMEGNVLTMQDIFVYKENIGSFISTGFRPKAILSLPLMGEG